MPDTEKTSQTPEEKRRAEMARLTEQRDHLKTENFNLRTERDNLKRELQEIHQQIQDARRELENVAGQVADARADLLALESSAEPPPAFPFRNRETGDRARIVDQSETATVEYEDGRTVTMERHEFSGGFEEIREPADAPA